MASQSEIRAKIREHHLREMIIACYGGNFKRKTLEKEIANVGVDKFLESKLDAMVNDYNENIKTIEEYVTSEQAQKICTDEAREATDDEAEFLEKRYDIMNDLMSKFELSPVLSQSDSMYGMYRDHVEEALEKLFMDLAKVQ